MVQSINPTGGFNTTGTTKRGLSFGSYYELQTYIATNATRLSSLLKKGLTNQVSDINFRAKMTYMDTDEQGNPVECIGLRMDEKLVSPDSIKQDTFTVMPQIEPVTVPIEGLSKASIQFSSGQVIQLDMIKDRYLILDNSVLNYDGRTRMSLSLENGDTATYTQNGNRIMPPWLTIGWTGDSYSILAQWTPGTDTVIQSTTDLVEWTDIYSSSWNSNKTRAMITVPTDSLHMFFRVYSY